MAKINSYHDTWHCNVQLVFYKHSVVVSILVSAVYSSASKLLSWYKYSHFSVFCIHFQYFTKGSIYDVCTKVLPVFSIFEILSVFIYGQNSVKILISQYTWRHHTGTNTRANYCVRIHCNSYNYTPYTHVQHPVYIPLAKMASFLAAGHILFPRYILYSLVQSWGPMLSATWRMLVRRG